MTMSYFAALEARIPMTAAERMMDAAQAALYPQLTKEGGEQLWDQWRLTARGPQPAQILPGGQRALFTFNGQAIAPAELKHRLSESLGDRAQVA